MIRTFLSTILLHLSLIHIWNDFSKIQGRFDTRLSLSASNVDEVIRKRVLAKNETATQTLRLLYEQKESIIKNLITFTADTADKKLYADKADFADCYQMCIRDSFHKTDSTNSVKPCICHFFHYRFKASCMNLVYQFSSLLTLFFVKCYLCSCCCPIYLSLIHI